MKKKLIALFLVTTTLVSACGAEEETSKEDIEINETEETPKADSASTTDDEEVAKTDGEETATSGDATATDGNMATGDAAEDGRATETKETYVDASVTVEQSDVNSNLWIITNTSDTTYNMSINDTCSLDGYELWDGFFAPGEVLYYFSSVDDGEISKDSFLFTKDGVSDLGEKRDTQCSVVTVSFDSSKYDESKLYDWGYAIYSLDDVWEAYKSKICYPDVEPKKYCTYVIYFRLFDANGNVIYEPADLDQFFDFAGKNYYALDEGLLGNPSIISEWDHAEFYVITTSR